MPKLRNIFYITALLACVPSLALAQSALPDPIQYIVAPETPGPNQQVSIQVQGVGTFLGDATISWLQDGKVVASSAGARTFTFTTGALGSQTHVQVKIVSHTQGTITHDFVFLPSTVNLIWEADTTVPPLYRGKALYSAGSSLKVVAFPTVIINGARVPSSALSYQWSYDDNPVPEQSGLGQNVFSFDGSELQNAENVSVDLYYGASKVGYGAVSIPATAPEVVLYDKDPLRGMLMDQALPQSGISLAATELTIQAVPYFFANSSQANGRLSYTWQLNDSEITGPDSALGMLTLRQTGSGQGAATLSVAVQNNDNDKLVQAAQTAMQIVFGQQASNGITSFFGL